MILLISLDSEEIEQEIMMQYMAQVFANEGRSTNRRIHTQNGPSGNASQLNPQGCFGVE